MFTAGILDIMQITCINFKSEKLKAEFLSPSETDPRVRALALELGLYSRLNGNNLKIRQIGRTASNQIEIYGYDKRSGHRERPARAIDFSVRQIQPDQIIKLVNHFSFYLDSGAYSSLLYHDSGSGYHLHLQVPHREYNKCLQNLKN